MEQVFGSDMNESVILYIEDVDLNIEKIREKCPGTVSSSTLRMWI